MLEIKVTQTTTPKAKPDENNLGFGTHYTDHMFRMDYTEGQGWHSAASSPTSPFRWTLPPWCSTTRRRALKA